MNRRVFEPTGVRQRRAASPLTRVAAACALMGLVGITGDAAAKRLPPTSAANSNAADALERPWLDPDAVDIDDEARTRSLFWERGAHPHRQRYKNQLERAKQFMRRSDAQSLAEARSLLENAIRLAPDQAVAYWYLAHVFYRIGDAKNCTAMRRKVADMEPNFEPPSLRGAPQSLDYGLGQCLALSGDYDAALAHFTSLLTRGDGLAGNSAQLRWRLGEVYMALGRLREAISSLEEAKRINGRNVAIQYALAAAYDRDGHRAAARKILTLLQVRDASQAALTRGDLRVVPPEDRYYYAGLARAIPVARTQRRSARSTRHSRLAPESAIVSFRHFLALHGSGPWAQRARQHLTELEREPLSPMRMQLSGGASLDLPRSVTAIAKANSALQACAAQTPNVIYRVRITVVVPAKRKRSGRRPRTPAIRSAPRLSSGGFAAAPGIRTRYTTEMKTDASALATAVECLDSVAATIALPKAVGPRDSWVSVTFPVVAQRPSPN